MTLVSVRSAAAPWVLAPALSSVGLLAAVAALWRGD
jgi:hypothetical protein